MGQSSLGAAAGAGRAALPGPAQKHEDSIQKESFVM